MKYVIDNVIKRLTEAQKEGKIRITENELIQIATPAINHIDEIICSIDKALETTRVSHSVTEVARLTSISRQTFYRWKKEGIIDREYVGISLKEIRENILKIKEIHERQN
jgi:DNA invertase Pin-like site-specific DNA recombinase